MTRLLEASINNDFYYMFFLVAKTTGRRIGELYGSRKKIEVSRKVIGKKIEYQDGKQIALDKTRANYKFLNEFQGGVKVKDIDFDKGLMKVWVLKRGKAIQDETILIPETLKTIRHYILKNKLSADDFLFRAKSYRAIQEAVGAYARRAKIDHVVSPHCISEDTEILTTNGWNRCNEILEGDNIYSYNLDKERIEQDKVKKVFIYNNENEVYHIKNRYIDSIVTLDHKIIAKYSRTIKGKDTWNDYKLISMSDLMNVKCLRQIKYLLGASNKEGRSIGKYRASLLGWILSDGCISKEGNISISQCSIANPKKCEIISEVLANSGVNYSIKIQKEISTGYNKLNGKKSKLIIFTLLRGKHGQYKGTDNDWIYEFINKDRTPKWELLNLNGSELSEVVDSMLLGDGTKHKNYNDFEYSGQNKKRLDFLRIACLFTNKKSSMGIKKQNGKEYFRTYITGNACCDIMHNIKKEKYNKKVWCIETNNGNFIAKRNDTIFLTGNSFRHYLITELKRMNWTNDKISKLTGHKSVASLAAYDHVLASDIKEEATKDLMRI